jgi:hypothetical protein
MAIILKANKVNLFVSSVLFVFLYHSPNVLDSPCIVAQLQKSYFVMNQTVIAILGGKSGDGLRGQEKGHRVEQDDDVGSNWPEVCFGYSRKNAEHYGHSIRNIVCSVRTGEGWVGGAGCGMKSVA